MNRIIVDETEFPCFTPVHTWEETGIEFKAGQGYNTRRTKIIDLAVWHWTGAEGKPETMAATLRRKKLGIEFAIYKGEIWQFCDPILVNTADAGYVNARSVGIEIINYGFRRKAKDIPRAGRGRPTYTTVMRNRVRTFAHFRTEDIAASLALAEALSTAMPIPRAVPLADGGFEVNHNTMTRSQVGAFKGHSGHFHISERKSDPGLDLLEAFRAAWAGKL